MPWTRRQVRLLLSKYSPLNPEQKAEMHEELHEDPELGHAKKGSKALSRERVARIRAKANGGK